ncbi:MAG: hypothetical protein AAFV07_03830 [Bacteroidota bacterium]
MTYTFRTSGKIWVGLIGFLLWLSPSNAQRPEQLDYAINTDFEEREPILSPDGNTLYFWRREAPNNTGGIFDPGDIWISTRKADGSWNNARRAGRPLNSKGHDFVWGVSRYQDTLWVMQVPPGVKALGAAYTTRNREGNWRAPEPIHIRDLVYDGNYKDFFLSPDRRILILPNVGRDTYGGTDLYICFAINDTAWSRPMNLGPTINSPGDEDAAILSADGRAIYFNSDGHGGLGGHDVFVSYRLDDSWRNWSVPENLGAPVNTKGYDFDFILSQDETRALWCSNHKTFGSNDIFEMELDRCAVDVYPGGDLVLCEGHTLTLEAGFIPGADIDFQWYKNGSPLRNGQGRKLEVSGPGDYYLVRRKGRCEAQSPVQRIEMVTEPTALIEVRGGGACLEDSTRLEARTDNGKIYQWKLNGLEMPGATARTLWVRQPGKYQVHVSNGSCGTNSNVLNLRRFNPPTIFTAEDTLLGFLPTLPHWLWTNKIPPRKGGTLIQDMAVTDDGAAYVLHTQIKRGRRNDMVSGFMPEGLFRGHFTEQKRDQSGQGFLAVDPEGYLIQADADRYLSKYTPEGRELWSKNQSMEHLSGVAVDPLGNIYSSGRFMDTLTMGARRLPPPKRGGIFLAKHSPRGELLWIKTYAVDGRIVDSGNLLHVDCAGQVYLMDNFELIANFEGPNILRAALRKENHFLIKWSPEGKVVWSKSFHTPLARERSQDAYVSCEGEAYLLLNEHLMRLGEYGQISWEGELIRPAGEAPRKARIHAAEGDLYIASLTNRDGFYVGKLNRLNRQVIIWKDRNHPGDPEDVPAISGDGSGHIYVSGLSKGNDFPGAQFDLTSNSQAFLLKYGRPDLDFQREPISLCDEEPMRILTEAIEGVRYQWTRNGRDIIGATNAWLDVAEPGSYQVRAFSDLCERISDIQMVSRCGEDPLAAPPVAALPGGERPDTSPGGPPIEEIPATGAPDPVRYGPGGEPRRIFNRSVRSQEQIKVGSTRAKIMVWDHAAVDRDTISLNVNGQWVLEEYGLVKKKKIIEYEFKRGYNYIILYALNLGGTPPNTASIMVDDGIRQQVIQLRSTLRTSGMLRVKVE